MLIHVALQVQQVMSEKPGQVGVRHSQTTRATAVTFEVSIFSVVQKWSRTNKCRCEKMEAVGEKEGKTDI